MRRSVLVAIVFAAACGDDGRIAGPPIDVGASDVAVVKARRVQGDHLLLLETPTPLADVERPARVLRRFRSRGAPIDYVAAPDAGLADFAVHDDGAVSVLLVSDAAYLIERWLPDGSRGVVVEIAGVAPARWSRDAGRIAAIGGDDIVVVRADDSAVRAYRYGADGRRRWDVLVEPANDLLPSGLISGSYDTFGQLRNPFRAYLDVGPDDGVWVAVPVDPGMDLLAAHNAAFQEHLQFLPGASADVLVTRLDGAGGRVFSRIAGTPSRDEIYGMRAVGGGVLVTGRAETRPGDAGGWDGLLVRIGDDGAIAARTLDVTGGDILFDVAVLDDGRRIAVGGTGYTDNPTGASISESCALLALVITDQTQTALPLPSLPRNNHLRTVLAEGATLWVGGMTDGPGTHSGDADPSAIRADPFVTTLAVP